MGDVDYWKSSYGKALGELGGAVERVEGAGGGGDKQARLAEADALSKRIQGMRRSYNLEIKLMREAGERAKFQADKADKDAQLEALQGRLARARDAKKEDLFTGRSPDREVTAKASTADEKLDQADRIQDMTEEKYKNMLTHLEEAQEVGAGAASTLKDQREQIGRITDDVIEMDANLTRADALIRVFSKRLATDRFIQCFGCLNVAALVAIILYVVINKTGLGTSDNSTPPSPV